jgi:hypothetical protein
MPLQTARQATKKVAENMPRAILLAIPVSVSSSPWDVGGAGKVAEIDGAYFGGYVKPANHVENRVDRRLARHQNGKRKVVVAIRERDCRTLTHVFKTEAASVAFIKSRVVKGTELMADEANSWNELHASYPMLRINHEKAYSENGACTNDAEEFFSRLRRAEVGHHHHIAAVYLARYAAEYPMDSAPLKDCEQASR